MESLILRGRVISDSDLRVIRALIDDNYDKGRTFISLAICEALNWTQPNGWPKERACRDVLVRLETLGAIQLPPRKSRGARPPSTHLPREVQGYDSDRLVAQLSGNLRLVRAKGDAKERLWNALMAEYHYLGYQVVVGRCLKYLVYDDYHLLAALSFSSPAWRLHLRDSALVKLGLTLETIHDAVINNSRFLILPGVRVRNLASRILSLATHHVAKDWFDYYSLVPLVTETFVSPHRFTGASYKAANWIYLGDTRGYGKRGKSHYNSQEPKSIFLYGLNRHVRRKLKDFAMQTGEG